MSATGPVRSGKDLTDVNRWTTLDRGQRGATDLGVRIGQEPGEPVERDRSPQLLDQSSPQGTLGKVPAAQPLDALHRSHRPRPRLEFDTSEHAHAFLGFLESQIWGVPENAPALAGRPEARVLEPVHL